MEQSKWMPLDYYAHLEACTKAARAITGNPKMQVVLDEHTKQPRTDGTVIEHYKPHYGMSQDEWVKWYGILYHEIGHSDPSCLEDFTVLKEKHIEYGSFEGKVLNIISDYCQEKNKFDSYVGRKRFLGGLRANMYKEAASAKTFGASRNKYPCPLAEKLQSCLETMFVWDLERREHWMKSCMGYCEPLKNNLNEQSTQWLYKMLTGDYGEVLDTKCDVDTHGSSAAIEKYILAQRIMDEVFELSEDEKKTLCEQSSSISTPFSEHDASSTESSSSSEQGTTEKAEDQESTSDKQAIKYKVEIDYDSVMMHSHDDSDYKINRGYGEMTINYDASKTYGTYYPYALSEIAEIDFWSNTLRGVKNDINHKKVLTGSMQGSHYKYVFDTTSGSKLSKKLQRLFKIHAKSIYIYGQKKGKLHAKNLYRTALNIQGYSDRIFKKRIASNIQDTAVCVLLDCSGSMSGEKFEHGGTALLLLSELLQSIQIQHELLGFTDWDHCIHYVFKPFGVKADIKKTRKYLQRASTGMSMNADGDSILWAINRLKSRPELLKIMIVLSDGQPAGGKGGDIDKFTRDVVKDVERDRSVDIYGIGIMDRNVHRIYKQCRSILQSSELEDALLDVIQSKIL